MLVLKIAGGIILAVILLSVGCSVLVASGTEEAADELAAIEAQVDEEIAAEETERQNRVSWEFVDSAEVKCSEYSDYCWQLRVTAEADCLNGLYAELNLLDESGTIIDYTNDSLGRLEAGRSAILTFDVSDTRAKTAEVAKVECH